MASFHTQLSIFSTVLFLISPLVPRGSIHAQGVTGELRLSVRDSLGEPIPGVNVIVAGAALQGSRGGSTDRNGHCVVLALPPGLVAVRLSHSAFQPIVLENIRIHLGHSTNPGTITLHQRVHEMPEAIVLANPLQVDATNTTYGSNLRPSELETLPLDRNYKEMITMLPLANTSFYGDGVSVGGSTGYENKYFVDGVEVTDPLFQTGGTSLPYNFVQEVEVRAGGYDADSRSALGAGLNVVTYSGTNDFKGSIFGFYTNNRLGLDRKIGLSDPTAGGFSLFDFGGSLGGPIIRDQLWFFAAYNPSFNRREVNVPDFGIRIDQLVVHSLAGKLTWKPLDRMNITLTATGDPSVENAVGWGVAVPPTHMTSPDSYLIDATWGGLNLSLAGTYMPSDNVLVDASLSRVRYHTTGQPATESGKSDVHLTDVQGNTWSGGPPGGWDSNRWATMARLATTMNAGDHTAEIGFEYKFNETNNGWWGHSIEMDAPDRYVEDIDGGDQIAGDRIPSVFLQDRWQITNNLSIHGGMRWDGQYIVDQTGSLIQKLSTPLQPRIGFVYSLDDAGERRISGSFGRYTQEFSFIQAVSAFSTQGFFYLIRYDHDPRISRVGGDTIWTSTQSMQKPVNDFRGQYFDEFSLAYEQALDGMTRIRIMGLCRTLREAIDDAFVASEGRYILGNPGRGELADWPRPQRTYTAAVVSLEHTSDQHLNYMASYVLSRTYGNYDGLFDPSYVSGFPNSTLAFDLANNTRQYGKGLLPNDRTHVFKLSGSYQFEFGLSTGIFFTVQSGTPLNEYANNDTTLILLKTQGTAGRMPAIWDLSARFSYDLPVSFIPRARLILDLFHIASQRTAVYVVQNRGTLDATGQVAYPDPNYGKAYRYQPPMSIRLGVDVRI
jgi:Carboxypeptidase regulatory-like domain